MLYRPANMPKPNTRFLRNIIKGTDSHNKALLAKEAAESKARLKRLERTEEIKRKKTNPSTKDIRERHMGDIQAILGGGRRKRRDSEKAAEGESRDRESTRRKTRDDKPSEKPETKENRSKSSSGTHDDTSRRHGRRRDDSRSRRSRHDDQSPDTERRSRRHRSPRDDRSRSPGRERRSEKRSSEDADRRRHRHRSSRRSRSPVAAKSSHDNASGDDLIGPAPPPKIRGRGAVGASSGIDRRFSESYDPSTDIQGDDA